MYHVQNAWFGHLSSMSHFKFKVWGFIFLSAPYLLFIFYWFSWSFVQMINWMIEWRNERFYSHIETICRTHNAVILRSRQCFSLHFYAPTPYLLFNYFFVTLGSNGFFYVGIEHADFPVCANYWQQPNTDNVLRGHLCPMDFLSIFFSKNGT